MTLRTKPDPMAAIEGHKEQERRGAAEREGASFVPAAFTSLGHVGPKLYAHMRSVKPDTMREPQFQWWIGVLAARAVEGTAAAYVNYYARAFRAMTTRRGLGARVECPL